MKEIIKIKSIENCTHDVLKIVTEKPNNLTFVPGQATELAINKPDWETESRPFTFTSQPKDDYLEFTIKTYPTNGVTNKLNDLKAGDELILNDVFGAIEYKDEGVFIAGGAGVTPFISILRNLRSKGKLGNNILIFANKTQSDIIHQQEFKAMLNENFINILSDEKREGFEHGYISKEFLKKYISNPNDYVYLCGPPKMMDAVASQLQDLNISKEKIITEEF